MRLAPQEVKERNKGPLPYALPAGLICQPWLLHVRGLSNQQNLQPRVGPSPNTKSW